MILWVASELRRASSEMSPICKRTCIVSHADTSDDVHIDLPLDVRVAGWCGVVIDGQVKEKEALENLVVTSTKFLIAVEEESETIGVPPFLLGRVASSYAFPSRPFSLPRTVVEAVATSGMMVALEADHCPGSLVVLVQGPRR
ncbi:hypothetical protein GUJ93_ZPchr0007g5745 [Zizania palustris]|uniref:Uncharacterized protein n=1 Tax=Zizania palustris TaxID=103762 RepID=A0A8J5T778_ZIZPA|nr:hypothetical protein GUJ93_ZPchr0007g5745 [Zizania palustris]